MAKKSKKIKASIVIKPRNRQIGKSIWDIDKKRKALKPGKRISRFGKVYYENRRNRSDSKGVIKKNFKKN